MNAIKYRIALFSENPDLLVNFYTQVLGFKQTAKVDTEEDYGYSIEVAPGYKIWIAKHSEVIGKSAQPFRAVLSIYVEDIKAYFNKVSKEASAKIIEQPNLVCQGVKGEERYIGAFLDPDGNCIQLMQLTGN